jgi:hypothetical protein
MSESGNGGIETCPGPPLTKGDHGTDGVAPCNIEISKPFDCDNFSSAASTEAPVASSPGPS